MIYIILLVALIITIVNNNDLKNEINLLKKNNYNYCPKCGYQLNKTQKQEVNNQPVVSKVNNNIEAIIVKPVKKTPKPQMSDEEVKNNIILITGSILIILAAVIYLTSSWTTSSNILKCALIFVLFFVFMVSSYIAKEKLKLNQTARAFNYIALAYLPLSLISLSIFGLLGDNFSINGSYQNFYLAITMFICSAIYYLESKKDKDMFLSISTIISSLLGIIFISRFINSSFTILLMFLYLYSYFLAMIYELKKFIYNEKFTKIILKIIFYTLLGVLIIINLSNLVSIDLFTLDILQNIALLLMNIGLSKYLGNNKLNSFLVPISIVLLFNYISCIDEMRDFLEQIIILLSIPVIYVYNYLVEKRINIFNFLLSSFVILIVFLISLVSFSSEIIPIYIVSLLYVILLFITYLLSDYLKKAILWMIPIFIELTAILFVVEKQLSINIALTISTILLVVSLLPKFKNYTKELVIIPTIINVIYILINYHEKSFITFIIIIISLIIYYLLFVKNNKNYKYPLYIFINLGMIYLGHIICNGLNAYTMALSIIIIIALEVIDERLKDEGNFAFILTDYIITALALTIVDKRTAFIMTIIISLVLAAYLLDNQKKIGLFNIPLLTPLIYVGTSGVMTFNEINVMVIISILFVVLTPFLLLKSKEYLVLSFVPYAYIIMQTSMNISLYIPYILALCVSIVYLLFTNKHILFKVLVIVSSLFLYYLIINDIGVTITLFTIGILIFYSLFITRNIMKNQAEDSKVLEYIILIVINAIAITTYVSEADGMLYVILLLIVTIFSYLRKYGPAFLVSIVFILINMFLLTRMFWLSLPWWIYILGVGIILILFAVLNEINEKDNVKTKLIDLKNNLKL